jgi:tetratricopeptide (TPR) repeat protein
MHTKNKTFTGIALILVILAATPMMFLAQAQVQTSPATQLVSLAEKAGYQVKNLIDIINSNDTALAQIDAYNLTSSFEENVALYETDGLGNLTAAQNALAANDYDGAIDYAFAAFRIFRQTFSEIHNILDTVELQKGDLVENAGLLEAIARELQRADQLSTILPSETPQEIFTQLEEAKNLLNEARSLLLQGNTTQAKAAYHDAKQIIIEVHQYLKTNAEESNRYRVANFTEKLQQKIQEKFQYSEENGINFTRALNAHGYQSKNQFMNAIQNRIEALTHNPNFAEVLQNCQDLSQMIQQMEQSLNQEINQHQGQNNSGGNDNGNGQGSGNSNGGSNGKGNN